MSAQERIAEALAMHQPVYGGPDSVGCSHGCIAEWEPAHQAAVIAALPDIAVVELPEAVPETLMSQCKWGTGVTFEKRTDARGGYQVGITLPDFGMSSHERTHIGQWPIATAAEMATAFLAAVCAAGHSDD